MLPVKHTVIEEGEEQGSGDDWLMRLVDAGATMDWITPAIALVGMMRGNLVQMATPLSSWGYTYSTLRGAGVKVSATQAERKLGVMLFCVPTKQVARVKQLLGGLVQ